MNPNQLMAHFERIGDAPDAIPRLRRFIFDLAVRGKLVPQNPKDEPSSDLLKRITADMAKSARAKTLLAADEATNFHIPSSWCWTQLGRIASYIQRGKSPKYATSGGTPVVSQRCVQWRGLDLTVAKQVTCESLVDYEDIRFLRTGDLLWNSTGTGTIGRVIRIVDPPKKLVCDSHVTVVRCVLVDSEYIRTWLRSDHVFALIENRAAGSTNQIELTAQMAINQAVPLPPLAEQHRIVARVDELMALCDRLEAAQAERETRRSRLTAASLARLNAPDPDGFPDDARFVLDTLPAITVRADQVEQLRQTILSLAIRGMLVKQNPDDEQAAELLKRIEKEKAMQLAAGTIKKERSLLPLAREEQPFDLPNSWKWCRLRWLATHLGDGIHGTPEYSESGSCYFINGNNLSNGKITFKATTKKVTEAEKAKHGKPLSSQSVLVSINGTLGSVGFYNGENVILGKSACYFNLTRFSSKEFVKIVLESSYFISYARRKATGTTIMNLSLGSMNDFPFPMPPLAEQHRIVSQVNKLMALCDQLEGALANVDDARNGLLNALVNEVLRPADERDEAA